MLNNLLDSGRFQRMVEQAAMDGKTAWTAAGFLAAVRQGIWSELGRPQVKIDAYRRNLQRAWLDLAIARVKGADTEEQSLYRAELKSLDGALLKARSTAVDRETKAHLDSARRQIRYDERVK